MSNLAQLVELLKQEKQKISQTKEFDLVTESEVQAPVQSIENVQHEIEHVDINVVTEQVSNGTSIEPEVVPTISAPKPVVDSTQFAVNQLSKNFELLKKSFDDTRRMIASASHSGGGEVEFRWLDDVNRNSITDNWLLEYDAASKKFQFTENVGPISSVNFKTTGPTNTPTPGQISYNQLEDCFDLYHVDGTVSQDALEQHMRVHNSTGTLLENGTVVRFAGVVTNGDANPMVDRHIANGTIPPLYTVGILTVDLANGDTGRATTYGKVRNLNTTGSDVGETWAQGDILYVSPIIAGKLTKVKPTAPNIVVVIAAVLKVHATEGILLVRPTIFPRLHYGTFVDKTNQIHTTINTPKAITFSTTDVANGFRRDTDTSKIIAEVSGLYNYKFSIQLVSSNSSAKDVYIWFRKNGVDISDSATRKTITGNMVYDIAAWDITVSMNVNDYFQIMWAVTDTTISITAPSATAFCPAIPSVILNITEAAL
jgi:hypothetical protein